MVEASITNGEYLKVAKELVAFLEAGDEAGAERALEEISALRESHLFKELGKLTRELHDTMSNFQLDPKMAALAQSDIPDAKERLNHVITMTEQAADRTLSAVENSLPISEELQSRVVKFRGDWERFRNRDMDVNEFRELSKELEDFFKWLEEKVPELSSYLTEVMMAQDFQDLTGQIIRRVITLVQDVEHGLVDLIRMTGQKIKPHAEDKALDPIEATGPAVPGVDTGDIMKGQDEVDDLLSSLGF